jgi:hypothetical protein
MTSTTKRRVGLLLALGGIVGAVVLGLGARKPREHTAVAAEPQRAAAAPYRSRAAYPAAPAPVLAEAPSSEAAAAPGEEPQHAPAVALPRGDGTPLPPAQTGTSWATSFRDEVCACRTRTCVRELGSRFVRAVGTTDYNEERDGETYREASRAAIKCLAALPTNS